MVNKELCPRIGYDMVKQNSETQRAITSKRTTVDITRMLHFKVTKLSKLLNFSWLWYYVLRKGGNCKVLCQLPLVFPLMGAMYYKLRSD